jgi:hypothetical protein
MAARALRGTPWFFRWLAVGLLLSACGCGRTATVSGKVTYQGRPVTYGSVTFLGPDQTAHSGVIGHDGNYTVAGVYPGEVKIGVISHDPSKGRSVLRGDKPARPGKNGTKPGTEGWYPLPHKFEDPEASGVGCVVSAGRVTYHIELR